MHITLYLPTQWALAWAVAGMSFVIFVILAARVHRLMKEMRRERMLWSAYLQSKTRPGALQ